MRTSLALFTILIISILVLTGCSSGSTTPTPTTAPKATPTITPTPEPRIAPGLLKDAYENGLVDYSLYPLELQGLDPELAKWIRPVIPAAIDPDNRPVATALVRGLGFLCENDGRNFVIAASGPFQVVQNMLNANQEAVLGAVLAWDIIPGGLPEGLIRPSEILEIVFIDTENGLVLLERINPKTLPRPVECPFEIGEIDSLDVGHKLVIIGHTKGDVPELHMPYQDANVSMVKRNKGRIYFTGSMSLHDWGSPIFYLLDGKPKLIGIVTGAFLSTQNETRAFGLSIEKIFEIIYEKTGIQLGGTP